MSGSTVKNWPVSTAPKTISFPLYAVSRRCGWKNAECLTEAAKCSRACGDNEMPREISWARSYILKEKDGKLGTMCLYEAFDKDTLYKHSAKASLPITEVWNVAKTIVKQPDPLDEETLKSGGVGQPLTKGLSLFLIVRHGFTDEKCLEEAAKESTKVANEKFPNSIRWVRSYVLSEADGKLGTVCIYEAGREEDIIEHACCAKLPVDEIVPIVGTKIIRPDPI